MTIREAIEFVATKNKVWSMSARFLLDKPHKWKDWSLEFATAYIDNEQSMGSTFTFKVCETIKKYSDMTQIDAFIIKERKAILSNHKGFYRSATNLITHILNEKGLTYCNVSNNMALAPSERVKSSDDICPHCLKIKYAQFL